MLPLILNTNVDLPLFIANKLTKKFIYQANFNTIVLVEYLKKEIENKGMVLVPKFILDDLLLNEETVNKLLPMKTKVIHQPRYYDYEKEQWIGHYGFWFEQTN